MGAIVIVVLLLCALLAGRIYIKKQRRNLQAERERKLKIAEGIFEDAPPPKVAKRKKRSWGWGSPDFKLEMPAFLQQELVNKAPILIERLLLARHACLAAADALKESERAHERAQMEVKRLSLPASPNRNDLHSWLLAARATCQSARQTGRNFRVRELEFTDACEAYRKAQRGLDKRLRRLDIYQVDDLPAEAARVLQIGRVAVQECRYEIHNPCRSEAPEYLDAPDDSDATADEHFEKLAEVVDRLLSAIGQVHAAYAAAQQEAILLEALAKGPQLVDPQKPTDPEVLPLLSASITWADRLQKQEEIAHGKVPDLKSANSALEAAVSAVKAVLTRLNALRIRNPADGEEGPAESIWVQPPPVTPPAPPVPPAADVQTEEIPKWLRKWDLDVEDSPDSGSSTAPALLQKKGLFTDEQECSREAASRLVEQVNALHSTTSVAANRWTRQNLPPVAGDGQEPGDQSTIDAVKAAMRRLGFAVAQRNAAQAKLAALRATPAQQVTIEEATLDEPNVESFVRKHRKRCDDRAANDAANKDQWDRTTAQQKQCEQRRRQMQEAVLALASVCGPALRADHKNWSRDLDATVRAAKQLIQRYTSDPTPVAVPIPTRPSSSSSKKKAARRR